MKKIKRVIVFGLLLFAQVSIGQMKEKDFYIIYVNNPNYSVKTAICSNASKFSPDKDLTYYWYSSNKIMSTAGGYDGRLLNGTYTATYLNGNLMEKGAFKKGLKKGEWIAWYDNGKIKEINYWKNGLKKNETWSINGEKISATNYKNGIMNGSHIIYKNGKISETKKYKNGIEIVKKETTPKVKNKKEKAPNKETKSLREQWTKLNEFTKAKLNKVFHKKEEPKDQKQKSNKKPAKSEQKNKSDLLKKKESKEISKNDRTNK